MFINEPFKSVLRHPIFWVPVLIAGSLMLFPSGHLLESDAAVYFVSLMTKMFGVINEYARYSAFPAEARLFLAIIFAALPFQAIVMFRRWYKFKVGDYLVSHWRKEPLKRRAMIAFLAPIVLIAAFWGEFLIGKDPSFCPGCTASNKLGFIFFIGMGPIIVLIVLCMNISLFLNIHAIFFDNRSGRKTNE